MALDVFMKCPLFLPGAGRLATRLGDENWTA